MQLVIMLDITALIHGELSVYNAMKGYLGMNITPKLSSYIVPLYIDCRESIEPIIS